MESYKLLSSDKKDDIKMNIINHRKHQFLETLILSIEIYGSTHILKKMNDLVYYYKMECYEFE